MHWSEIINPHLKDSIRSLTDDDWEDIEIVASSLMLQHDMSRLNAEANALIAMVQEKEKGCFSRLKN